ncbi:TPA: ead/Ea22-like family protein [Salmonella enterica]|uniref:Ead/Ea22-like family protein n=1 Tax=Salmonella enterica TaxID=28901 RepID=A0A743TZS1_SALER|nr:ead/Ea22-like family protein [Salmonella enterica]HAF2208488.1 ead/Ea22-like family protein [Salmonella enterica]
MSNIDKQALREAAEKVNSGEWSYEEFNRMDLPGGAHININGRDAIYCLKKPVGGVEQSRAVTAFIAAFNPKVALALLDENLQLQREKDAIEAVALALRDDMRHAREQLEAAEKRIAEQREYYEGVIADGSKRIAELEARTVNLPKRSVGEVMHLSGFSRDYAEGWCAGNDNAIHEIRAAGIVVKGE